MKLFITLSLLAFSLCTIELTSANSCPFCKDKVIERQSVFESDYFNVLLDYEPHVRGHLLLVAKRHIGKAHELCKEEWEELAVIVPRAVKVFSEFLNTDQYIILEKNGPKAYQEVPHVHFHLLPIHSQTWEEILGIKAKQMGSDELKNEVNLFRSYFLNS